MTTDKPSAGDTRPRVADNDAGEISVAFNGKELRGWSYKDDAERRIKMLAAREYVEGWCDGRDAIALAPPVAERPTKWAYNREFSYIYDIHSNDIVCQMLDQSTAGLIVAAVNSYCTCGGDIGQPADHHDISCPQAILSTPPVAERGAQTGVMRASEKAAETVASWSPSKQAYAARVTSPAMPVAERGGGGAQTSPVIPSRKKLAEIIDAAWKKNGSVPFPLYLSELEWIANDIYEALSSHPSTVPTPTPETGDGSDTRPERGSPE